MSPTDPNVGEKLAALRREYSARLPSRIALIVDIWQKLNRHGCNAIMCSTLVNLVHQLSGSGRTFGYAALSEHASALEARISPLKEQTAMPSDAERTTIDAMIAKLKESAQKPDTTEPARVNAAAPRKENFRPGKLIYVIDDDTALAEYLATQLRERGFQTRTFDAPNLFHEELAHENPAAILMDIGFPEGDLAGIDAVAQLRAATGARTPVIFVSGRSDMSSRLAAIRAGGDAYLTKPVDLYTLGMTLEELTTQTAVEKLRVLIIDDDKTLAEHYAAVLNQTGMTARVLLNPMHALQHIKEFHPNLVLMDFHLPQCNGIELSKVLRQEQALADLPIVFISVDPHPDIQRRIFGMGETDFLQKPVKDDVLTATVLKCIKRSRWISNRVNDVVREDPATGLLNRRHLLADLEMAVAGATAGNNYPAVLFVAIDNLDVIRKSTGVSGIEYTLRQVQSALRNCLTSADSLCHYSEGVYVALTARRTPEAATALVARVRATLEQLSTKTERDGTRLAVSVGFHLITPESRNARHALGEAERLTGGSAITVPDTPKVATTAPGDISVETVRHALEAQSFRLVYQPIVNLGDLGQELFEARV
ncbi:MAG: response regulator, partial [Gammaproteobacteria bacterium]|nr:response regulator [Gammaproteobacteria bacterium]